MKTFELTKDTVIPFSNERVENRKREIARRVSYPKDQGQIKFFGNPQSDVVYHEGFFGYLSTAWSNHYSIVLRPSDLWFVILNELTAVVAKTPQAYSNLFTKKPSGKQLILVPTDTVETISPELVVDALKSYVPTKVDDFLPEFSTSNSMCNLAMNVAFCDMVSPYYSYGTFMCGFPKVRIEGTKDDWALIQDKLNILSGLFSGNLSAYLKRCLNVVENIVSATKEGNATLFKNMVKLQKCGSGSQYEMSGWIMQLLYKCDHPTQLEGLPPHYTHMDYTNMETERKFSLYCGVFYSTIDGDFLLPEYDAFRFEILEQPKAKSKDEADALEMAIVSAEIVKQPRKLKGVWRFENE
jgi:hypothetical protein